MVITKEKQMLLYLNDINTLCVLKLDIKLELLKSALIHCDSKTNK